MNHDELIFLFYVNGHDIELRLNKYSLVLMEERNNSGAKSIQH